MSFKIFYSWQSDADSKVNKNFIQTCLEKAIKRIKQKYKDDSPDLYLDRDTKDVPGFPNIPTTIESKIAESDVFVGDLTFLGKLHNKNISNSNVIGELSYAQAKIGENRLINVLNAHYGDPSDGGMPFDIAQRRYPIIYSLSPEASAEERKEVAERLTDELYQRIKLIFDTEQERRRNENAPFETWNTWDSLTQKDFEFETSNYIETIFNDFHEQLKEPRKCFRLLGLSGIGKTNLMLHFFKPGFLGLEPSITNKVVYADLNECDHNQIREKVKEFFRTEQNKVVVLDNCPLNFHVDIMRVASASGSKLNLVTISPDPDESRQEIDLSGQTNVIKLLSREFKPIVRALLDKNFTDLNDDDKILITEYSNGLPFFAVLMARSKEQTRTQPGSLTPANILQKILGDLYTDPENKKVILACSIFSAIGYLDHQKGQEICVALSNELCDLTETDEELRIRQFQKVTQTMRDRQLLEKIGFSYAFRPTPLALKLAEQWWEKCSAVKFEKIIPVLKEAGLVEKFCQQFRLLSHIQYAKDIVGRLCGGVFSNAEVLNTEVGSRLFRSFVNVNPVACAEALTKAFGQMDKVALKKISQGRRNLVWALEQLCFREETFDQAVRIMGAFAVAENENISNNATGQFLQLFHIRLPGTSVNLKRRWAIIEEFLAIDDEYHDLGISATNRAMKGGRFTRMIGAEEQRTDSPVDYQPNYSEIGDYWYKAAKVLFDEIKNNTAWKSDAIDGLLSRIYTFCESGLGMLIIPMIEELYESGDLDWQKLRKTILFIMRGDLIFDDEVSNALKRLLKKITPSTLEANLQMYVKNPTSDDYFKKDKNGETDRDYIKRKVDNVAVDWYGHSEEWQNLMPEMTRGHIAEGINFGSKIASLLLDSGKVEEFLELYFKALKDAPEKSRNTSIIIGFFREWPDRNLAVSFYRKLRQEHSLKSLRFSMAQSLSVEIEDIYELIEDVNSNQSDVVEFLAFNYGWGLKHFSEQESLDILKRICFLNDEGKAIAFTIAYTWAFNEKELWGRFSPFLRDLIINDSLQMVDHLNRSTELYGWSEASVKLLKATNDRELAASLTGIVIAIANRTDGFFRIDNNLYGIIDVLQSDYFPIFWGQLSEMYLNRAEFEMARHHFRDLLGAKFNYQGQTEGLLFKGDPKKADIIFEWAKLNRGKDINFLGTLMPLHASKESGSNGWHPIALKFIEEFADDKEFLEHIEVSLGSYSWVNSVVPKYKRERKMFEELLGNSNPSISEWASKQVAYLDKRIEFEQNRDEEDFRRI